ncbi:MAG: hypothetical protein ACXW31_11290 [Thermoanaerobaculia bacterium]
MTARSRPGKRARLRDTSRVAFPRGSRTTTHVASASTSGGAKTTLCSSSARRMIVPAGNTERSITNGQTRSGVASIVIARVAK